jgi:site-specific recombinase XerC
MPVRPERARAVLSRVDPTRLRSGRPVGLRDGALVALVAAGLNAEEICGLLASSITMDRGNLLVAVRRHGVTWRAVLPTDLGARLLAWLTERRLWADPAPVFTGPRGNLSPMAVHQVLHRYRRQQRARG